MSVPRGEGARGGVLLVTAHTVADDARTVASRLESTARTNPWALFIGHGCHLELFTCGLAWPQQRPVGGTGLVPV